MSDTVIIQLIGFGILIAGYFFNIYTKGRERKWDLEDRKNRQDELLKNQVEVKQKIEENTAITLSSLDLAQTQSEKIEKIEKSV